MIIDITEKTHQQVKNPDLAKYTAIYLTVFANFMDQVRAMGIHIDPEDYRLETEELLGRLRQKSATFRNQGRSIYFNQISPACVACRKGIGSATFFISLKCHRDCYYCFNPNQVEYERFAADKRNLIIELEQIYAGRQKMSHLALTGGEPLLYEEEAIAFFEHANHRFPDTHKRLYTCGDHTSKDTLRQLQTAGLDEIRFSIRMHDLAKGHQHTLAQIERATHYIPTVMVEMPVLPGTLDIMKEILIKLDRLHIHSINLLEFCYPFINAPAFNQQGFMVKNRPFETLYNYWYAGGVPIARSEIECLALMEFGLDQKLKLGVHYCSLENKLTGQNYQQNHNQPTPNTAFFSETDYLLKTAKVFGKDIAPVLRRLRSNGYRDYERNKQHNYLAFHINQIPSLAGLEVEIGLSTGTLEMRQDEQYLRELKVDLTYPELFEPARDV